MDSPAAPELVDGLEGQLLEAEVIEVLDGDQQVVARLGEEAASIEVTIPLGDFRVAQSDVPQLSAGERFEVHVEQRTQDGKRFVASRDKALRLRALQRVEAAFRAKEPVEGEVVGHMEGGFAVDVGVRAFLPSSQVALRPIRKTDEVLGQRFTFSIIRFEKNRQNVVVSRRVLLETERKDRLGRLREGAVVEGTIRSFTEYGAFVDIGGGVEGLLHIEEMSWTKVRRPQNVVAKGDVVKVKVIKLEKGKGRISLSLRQLQDDPWSSAADKYSVGSIVNGLVVSKTDFGVFLEIEPGLEGLVHSAGKLVSPRDAAILKRVDIGDELAARVLDVDQETRRMSLALVEEA